MPSRAVAQLSAWDATLSEEEFASLVDEVRADPQRRALLIDLLREDNPIYDGRGTAATIRMRGWIMAAFEPIGLPDSALPFVLEELDNGRDAYLVAAASRALRRYATPAPAFAPFLVRAIANIRYHDDIVSFERYGAYVDSGAGTTAIEEVLTTLGWLGRHARGVVGELEMLLHPTQRAEFSGTLLERISRTVIAIHADCVEDPLQDDCCAIPGIDGFRAWPRGSREVPATIEATVFEDQEGNRISFGEFFHGRPSVVVFFYTRCDNPRKCSLSIAKLGRLQQTLVERGLSGLIRTAAITYDPAWDLPARLRGYGQSRSVRMDADNRMLRTIDGLPALRAHFRLGVNFIESLVNRHRVEVFILDARGSMAAAFERIQWDERQVADQVALVLEEQSDPPMDLAPEGAGRRSGGTAALAMLPALASVATVFWPKCPICWAAYLSLFGIAGLERILYQPWLLPAFIGFMVINLASLWVRGLSRGSRLGFYLGAAGAFAILVLGMKFDLVFAGPVGVILTFGGSLLSVAGPSRRLRLAPGAAIK